MCYVQDWLVESIRERLKYFRRNKTVAGNSSGKSPSGKSTEPLKQMPCVSSAPLVVDDLLGEDEDSHDRHVKVL